MPTNPLRRTFRRHLTVLAALALMPAARTSAQSIPARLADTTFWRMVNAFSEPGGFFRSDNFVSNETSFQWVIPELQRTVKPGGVYVGVAPDQNFTYLVALKPGIAFIVDIRHQNAIQHLMYKALIELSADRAEFVSRLFSRERPAGLDTTVTAAALFQAFSTMSSDSALRDRNLTSIKDRLVKTHAFALTQEDLRTLDYVYGAFYASGPNLTYTFGGGYGGANGRRYMPTFEALMTESDGAGQNRSYLATEANYRALKNFEERNLIVPLTGNFAGEKTFHAVGQWVRDRGATITAIYTSNVEQYLFQGADEWSRFYKNVATLPVDSTSTFIRSFSMRGTATQFRQQSTNSNSVQLLSSVAGTLKAFGDGTLHSYWQVLQLSHQ